MPEYPFFREVRSPITAKQLTPLHAKCERVQFSEPLTQSDHKKLAAFLRGYPKVALRVYGHYFEPCDLGFLRHYPEIRNLAVEVFDLEFRDDFKFVCRDLESLVLGQTKRKTQSLSFLGHFPRLRRLYVEGHTKDLEVIESLTHLTAVTLRSITLPDLSILKPLSQLLSLGIKLGGTNNLGLLPKIGRLRYIELWMVRGLDDIQPIGAVRTLQALFLHALKNVTKLPSLGRLPLLWRLQLHLMKGLSDLRPAAKAPALEELVVFEMPHLEPLAFRPFVGHPTLRRASVFLGGYRKNKAVADLLHLPRANDEFSFRDLG